jgi:hypothetical protein
MNRRKRDKIGSKQSGKFDQSKEVRAIARERVGAPKPSQAILPKTVRKKPKHKKALDQD